MSLKDQIRTELVETRHAYHQLLEEVTDYDWSLPSDNPAWTLGELMYHITVATQNIPFDIAIIRKAPWFPNPPIRLLNLLNTPLTRWGASQYPRSTLAEKFDQDHARLLELLDTVQDDEWEKGRTYNAYDPPLLEGFVTIEDLFRYQTFHFEEHARDIRAILQLLRGYSQRHLETSEVLQVASKDFRSLNNKDAFVPEGETEISPVAEPGKDMLPYPGGGWLRALFRAPIPLWRLGLGPFLGKVMMLLTHTGRKTGQIRRTMVEYHPMSQAKYVAAAWGEKADWVRNLQVYPYVTIQTTDGREHVKAERVTNPRELLAICTVFKRRDPPLTRWYLQSKGINPDSPADLLSKKDRVHFIRFAPAEYPDTEPTLPPVHADLKWVLPAIGVAMLTGWIFLKNRHKT